MGLLPIEDVREIALCAGFFEIQHNEYSRVVVFHKAGVGRINVYYTTGTVATCIDHPRMGKTQLFRRDQAIDNLKIIFKNPRVHTGTGYYKTTLNDNGNIMWTNTSCGETLCDNSRLWLYVYSVVTNFCNPRQAKQIVASCELWHKLQYVNDMPTVRQAYESYPPEILEEVDHFCPNNCGKCGHKAGGSICNLGTVLSKVVSETDPGDILPALFQFVHKTKDGDDTDDDDDDHDDDDDDESQKSYQIIDFPMSNFFDCQCEAGCTYRESHGDDLERFRRQLMAFPKRIRRELVYFFFKELSPDYNLVVRAGEGTKCYPASYLSNEVHNAKCAYRHLVCGCNSYFDRT